jgi:hypothetical protein
MHFYAQLNENDICIGVSQLSGEINTSNMIAIDAMDTDYLWKKYENGQWSAEKYEPVSTALITEFEDTQQRVADLEMAMAAVMGGAI